MLAATLSAFLGLHVSSPLPQPRVAARGGAPIAQGVEQKQGANVETWKVWQSTASGLKFQDELVGEGAIPAPGSVISLHYTVSLAASGMELGTTRGRWPLTFAPDKHAVPIFSDAVEGMRVGGRRRLVVPADRVPLSQSNNVPRDQEGESLRFEIELLRPETGVAAIIPSILPPGRRRITIARALFALSCLPYFLPEELKPDLYRAGDPAQIQAAREAAQANLWHGVPIDSLWP